MDRILEYPTETPMDIDDLRSDRNSMVALAKLTEAMVGQGTALHGLFCKPTTIASLDVLVEGGEIYSYENIDNTDYGALPADTTNQVVKQGIALEEATFNCPAPGTVGNSIDYLIQIKFEETDDLNEPRPYYNASNPDQPFIIATDSQRSDHCVRKVKAGVSAPTGTQVPPAPDSGFVGAWVVTVNEGQTQIIAIDIVVYSGAPFIKTTRSIYYVDAINGGSNNYIGTPIPSFSAYEDGLLVVCVFDSLNTGDSTLDLGYGVAQIIDLDNAIMLSGEIQADRPYILIYYNNKWVIQTQSQQSEITTGDVKYNVQPSLTGWINVSTDGTIGNAVSGASIRNNADTENLFVAIWDNTADGDCPVLPSGHGASAIADFNANKTIRVPLMADRVLGGKGSTHANGSFTGDETFQLQMTHMPSHAHGSGGATNFIIDEPITGPLAYPPGGVGSNIKTTTDSQGGNTAHTNMQPCVFIHAHMKL